MKTIFKLTLGLSLFANGAYAGDEVIDGRTPVTTESEQFCTEDPSTKKEVCVPKDQKDELLKKLKKSKEAPDTSIKPGVPKPPKL